MPNDTTIKLPTIALLSIVGIGGTGAAVKYSWEIEEPSAYVVKETAHEIALKARVLDLEGEVEALQKDNKRKQDEIHMIKAKMALAKLDLINPRTPDQQRTYDAYSRMVTDITVELGRDG